MTTNYQQGETMTTATISSNSRSVAVLPFLIATALVLAVVAVLAPRADAAPYGVKPGTFTQTLSTTSAGAHPDMTTHFEVTTEGTNTGDGSPVPTGDLRDLTVSLPPGLVGNANATPKCNMAQVLSFNNPCPLSTAVGEAKVLFSAGGSTSSQHVLVFNISPYKNEPAAFGLFPFFPVRLDTRIGPDYQVEVFANKISEAAAISVSSITFWGVPAEHNGPGTEFDESSFREYGGRGDGVRLPFLTNPTSCSAEPLSSTLAIDSWENPGVFDSAVTSIGAMTDCAGVGFEPTVTVAPQSRRAGAPSGYAVDIAVPQNESPDGIATSTLDGAKIVLPQGVSLSPPVAQGLGSCSDAQFAEGSTEPANCPESSKVGTVSVDTPLLEAPLEGSAYIGEPQPGNRYRLFLAFAGSGVQIKLDGKVELDPQSGQITTTFADNPQLPFSELRLRLKGGSNAVLSNPAGCGTYATAWELTPHSGRAATSGAASMTIDEGCRVASQFTPGLEAGAANPVAGAASPFLFRVTREDGQQNISRIDAVLPRGELAKLAGVPLCSDAQATGGSCPAASQIGTTAVEAGPGSSPLYLPQPGKAQTGVYLAGPYKAAPYSLVVEVPAQAGPYDLGTVAVRSGIYIDPTTTQVTVKSDPLPQILEGVPISYRNVLVDLERPNFTVNPTSCEPMSVDSTIVSTTGGQANPSSRFQVGECAALGLAPRLALKFSGAPTRRGGHPKLTATLTTTAGDANLRQVQVTLPKTEYLENAHIRTVCTRVQYAANQCPEQSIYGWARAWTPLLDKPLEGPVYLRSSSNKLPDLVASLDGQIHVDLAGRISSYKSRIRNTFETVPDAPVSKFELTMQGGGKGLLVNNTDLCKAKPVASVEFNGQNGKVANTNPLVSVGGCGKGGKKGKKK